MKIWKNLFNRNWPTRISRCGDGKLKKKQNQTGLELNKPAPKIGKLAQKDCNGIRTIDIPESVATDGRSAAEKDTQKVVHFLDCMEIRCPISDLQRVGKFTQNKTRPLILKVSAPWEKYRSLLSLYKLMNCENKIYIKKKLSLDEQNVENNQLKLRRDFV